MVINDWRENGGEDLEWVDLDWVAIYYESNCKCGLCRVIREFAEEKAPYFCTGGWIDPRRFYLEKEDEFLKRVPDGFITWPEDHKWLS